MARLLGPVLVSPALVVILLLFMLPLAASVIGAFEVDGAYGLGNFAKAYDFYTQDIVFTAVIVGLSTLITGLLAIAIGGYLTLGEETPGLSGGEAQRLKLASEMGRPQADSLFLFDEPTIGLHPLDVATLLRVFQTLLDQQATVIVIEHDLDVIRNADYIVDMGPGGGESGGRIVAAGTLETIKNTEESVTGRFL